MDGSTSLHTLIEDIGMHMFDPGGRSCPCCGQNVKAYRRKLNAQMVRFLIWLAKESLPVSSPAPFPWFGLDKFPIIQKRPGGGDFAKLRFWGLIEELDVNEKTVSRSSGVWRITSRGMSFVLGKIKVPEAVWIFNNKMVEGLDVVPYVSVHDALGTRYTYAELWNTLKPEGPETRRP